MQKWWGCLLKVGMTVHARTRSARALLHELKLLKKMCVHYKASFLTWSLTPETVKMDLFPLTTMSSAENLLLNTKLLPVFFNPFRPVPERFSLTSKSARKSSMLGTPDQPLYTSWACTPSTSFWSPGLLAAFPAISTCWWSSLRASGRCRP